MVEVRFFSDKSRKVIKKPLKTKKKVTPIGPRLSKALATKLPLPYTLFTLNPDLTISTWETRTKTAAKNRSA